MHQTSVKLQQCPSCQHGDIRPYWRNVQNHDFDKCKECGFFFVNPQPDTAALESYYSNQYFMAESVMQGEARTETTDADRIFADKIERIIRKRNPKAKTICEIGCSFGYVLAELARRGYDVTGYELSATTSEFARNKLNLNVHTGVFEAPQEQFDVIFMSHVLEHAPNPNELLKEVQKALAPNGLVIVIGPNSSSLNSKLFGKHCSWIAPPDHLSYFGTSSLRRLYKEVKLKPVYLHTEEGRGVSFFLGLALAAVSRTGREVQLKERIGGVSDAGRGGILSKLKGGLMKLLNLFYLFTWPTWKVVNWLGYGEEMWVAGQKKHVA